MPTAPSRVAGSRDASQAIDLDAARIAIIDELGELDCRLAAFDLQHPTHKSDLKRREAIREEILAWYPHLPGEQEAIAEGSTFDARITARDFKREVTPQGKRKLSKLWGIADFLLRSKVDLKQLDSIPKTEHGLYTINERNGSRHVESLPRAAKAA